MKILIYTPIDETAEYQHAALLSGIMNLKVEWISPVLFAQYLRETKLAATLEESLFKGIITTNQYMLNMEQRKDIDTIIIGNCSRDYKFDLIIGYTSHTDFTPEPEFLLDKMRQKYGDEPQLSKLLNDLYKPADCESFLYDSNAVANFIRKVIDDRRA